MSTNWLLGFYAGDGAIILLVSVLMLATGISKWNVAAAAVVVLLAAGMMLSPSAGRADEVTIKTIKPDDRPDVQPLDQPRPAPASEPVAGETVTAPKSDVPKPAGPVKAEVSDEKPLFVWPPPTVVVRSTIDRLGLTDEQKAKTGPILNAADKEVATLLKEMKDKEPQERRAAVYRLCDATITKLLPLLSESQGRRLKGALKGTIAAPQGVRISISRDGTLSAEQPSPSAIVDLWLAQYAPGAELAEPQASELCGKLMPLAEKFAELQSAMASTYVAAGDKDDPEEVAKRRQERLRQEKELYKQHKPRREILKSVREAISQALSAEQREAAHQDRQAELEAGVRPILNYHRRLLTRADLNFTVEQKQKGEGLINAADEALAKIAAGDEDLFSDAWGQLYRQLGRDLRDVMTTEQKEKLFGPPPPPAARKEAPKQGDNSGGSGPTVLPPI